MKKKERQTGDEVLAFLELSLCLLDQGNLVRIGLASTALGPLLEQLSKLLIDETATANSSNAVEHAEGWHELYYCEKLLSCYLSSIAKDDPPS